MDIQSDKIAVARKEVLVDIEHLLCSNGGPFLRVFWELDAFSAGIIMMLPDE